MKVDKQLVKGTAELAQLRLDAKSQEAHIDSMQKLLDLLAELQTVDTQGVLPLFHPLDRSQTLRADRVTETDLREKFQKLAPAASDGLYLVPRVVE